MDTVNMPDIIIKPTILLFAGPNGSGKSTITKYVEVISPYINADDVKKIEPIFRFGRCYKS